ncbi:hypothetical protein ccbrp13_46320 [Ktedonobacteria bacterium brp13]|nr:hypothetical protein ccbrp13_46320 [Ktedonobacteria bacterium brp13]
MNSTFITIICAVVAVVALLLAFLLARGGGASASSASSASVEPKANVEAASTQPVESAQSAEPAPVEQQPDFQHSRPLADFQRSQPLQPQVTRQFVQDHVEAPEYVAKQTVPVADFNEAPTTVNNHVQPEVSHLSHLTHAPSLSLLHENNSNEITAVSRHLYEIAGQVHILQRQSQEIEQSLAQLSGVIERLQQQQHTQPPRESIGSLYTNARPYGESNF